MVKLDNLKNKKIISQFDLRDNLDKVPSHWKLEDWEIEEKIKDLRKEIYELQNSRKKQPKLLIFESLDSKTDRCRIFEGWAVRFDNIQDKNPVMIADNWRIATEKDLPLIQKELNCNEAVIKLIKNQK